MGSVKRCLREDEAMIIRSEGLGCRVVVSEGTCHHKVK